MFADLTDYQTILVSGPQRSGTRFVATAVAHDTGHTYVDEAAISTDSLYQLLWVRQTTDTPIVVQCPGLCSVLPSLVSHLRSTFVVMCLRQEAEILASQARIGWDFEWLERLHYPGFPDEWPVCRRKYHVWRAQREKIPGLYREVWYHTLTDHPLWVSPEERGPDWGFSQTKKQEDADALNHGRV